MVDVLQDFVKLYKRGVNYVALCPFHDDKNYGNFVVSPNKNIYHCFACGQSGDGITFLMEHEHMSYVDAIKWLANKYYIDVEGDGNNGNEHPGTRASTYTDGRLADVAHDYGDSQGRHKQRYIVYMVARIAMGTDATREHRESAEGLPCGHEQGRENNLVANRL